MTETLNIFVVSHGLLTKNRFVGSFWLCRMAQGELWGVLTAVLTCLQNLPCDSSPVIRTSSLLISWPWLVNTWLAHVGTVRDRVGTGLGTVGKIRGTVGGAN